MNKRQRKKLQTRARCLYLSNRYGTIERGYFADYFRKFPSDFKKVRKLLKSKRRYVFIRISNDVKTCYKHPSYKEEKSKYVISKLRLSDFIPYLMCKDVLERSSIIFDLHNLKMKNEIL